MIIILKKWNVCLIFSLLLISVYSAGLFMDTMLGSESASIPAYGKKIVIDAGHGEPDGGAVGPSGVKEQELNLKVAEYLQHFLEQSGVEVIMTRADESGLSGTDAASFHKREDMKTREEMMNSSDADLFLSIHMNRFTESKYSGPQVFYAPNGEDSKRFAEILQQELISVLAPPSKREIKKAGSDIYLLKKAKVPAALAECGFLSNPQEEAKLRDEAYRKEIAWALYSGIIEYFAKA